LLDNPQIKARNDAIRRQPCVHRYFSLDCPYTVETDASGTARLDPLPDLGLCIKGKTSLMTSDGGGVTVVKPPDLRICRRDHCAAKYAVCRYPGFTDVTGEVVAVSRAECLVNNLSHRGLVFRLNTLVDVAPVEIGRYRQDDIKIFKTLHNRCQRRHQLGAQLFHVSLKHGPRFQCDLEQSALENLDRLIADRNDFL